MGAFTPQAFGKYYLVDKIATGGMAEIFKAKTYSHGGFENLLVIKRILPHIGESEDFIEMFIDEAKVSVALQHPNIVRIYDFGKIHENYFIAMECVDGKDTRNLLRKLSKRKKYLPVHFASFIAHEVAKGLHYAHTRTNRDGEPTPIIHRDISPSNVLISYDGEVKIADFGIAKAETNAYKTRDGVLKGKFEYMSPEQATGQDLTAQSDLFSLGIILYETLTGRRLFKSDSEIKTLKRIRDGVFDPPRRLNPRIPEELERITLKALQNNPEQRYASGQELAADLRDFLFPLTADQIRHELAGFMKEVFLDEIAAERARLEAGSEVAERLKETSPPVEWGERTDSTMSKVTGLQRRSVLPWLAFMVLTLMVASAVLLAGAAVVVSRITHPPQAVPVAATGSLDILVLPAAQVLVDGRAVGHGDAISVPDLAPGEHIVRLEAEGYQPVEETVKVAAGAPTRFARTLTKSTTEAAAVEPEVPEAPSGPPQVAITSKPSGATVRIDGNVVGTTPITWTDGEPGQTYRVQLSLGGYEAAYGELDDLRVGGRTKFSRSMKKEASPGTLTVTLVGGGWAHVYVNDSKLEKTAPLKNWSLPAGSHRIRVENPALGIAHEEEVVVQSGAAVRITARPQ